MSNAETDLQRRIQMEASRMGARLFRNNVGNLLLADGRRIQTGLCVGSSDLIGWVTMPDGVARFVACEIKTPTGRVSPAQENFIECVARAGGIAGVCRSIDDLHRLLGK